jgi:hypothetical protein
VCSFAAAGLALAGVITLSMPAVVVLLIVGASATLITIGLAYAFFCDNLNQESSASLSEPLNLTSAAAKEEYQKKGVILECQDEDPVFVNKKLIDKLPAGAYYIFVVPSVRGKAFADNAKLNAFMRKCRDDLLVPNAIVLRCGQNPDWFEASPPIRMENDGFLRTITLYYYDKESPSNPGINRFNQMQINKILPQ